MLRSQQEEMCPEVPSGAIQRYRRCCRASVLAAAAPANALEIGDPGTAAGLLKYQCVVPIIGEQPVEANVKSNIPLTWPEKTTTPQFNIAVDARAKGDTFLGLQLVGVSSLVGKGSGDQINGGSTKARIIFPTATGGTGALNLSIKITIPETVTPQEDPGEAGVAIRRPARPRRSASRLRAPPTSSSTASR